MVTNSSRNNTTYKNYYRLIVRYTYHNDQSAPDYIRTRHLHAYTHTCGIPHTYVAQAA